MYYLWRENKGADQLCGKQLHCAFVFTCKSRFSQDPGFMMSRPDAVTRGYCLGSIPLRMHAVSRSIPVSCTYFQEDLVMKIFL